MYDVDGDFGKVRLAYFPHSGENEGLFSVDTLGWHKCNDKYRIDRAGGCENHLIIYTVEGNGKLVLDGKTYNLTKDTLAFIPRDVKHSYYTEKGKLWEFYWIHPEGNMCNKFLDRLTKKECFFKTVDDSCDYSRRFEELLSLNGGKVPDTNLFLSQKTSELLHYFAINLYESPRAVSLSSRAIIYMEQHIKSANVVDKTAKALFVSTPHLIRTFKKEVGCTPHQYLLNYRLSCSVQLLKFSDLKVEEIAEELGFSSSSHYISSFHKKYGVTPAKYKR